MSLYSVPPALGALLCFLLGIFVWSRKRGAETHITFFLSCLATTVWLTSYSIAYSTTSQDLAILCARIACTAVAFVSIFIYHFVVVFIRRDRERKYVQYCYGITFTFLIGFLFSDVFLRGTRRYFWGFYSEAGLLHPAYLLITYAMWIRCFYLLYQALKSQTNPIAANQIKYTLAAFVIGMPATIDYIPKYGIEIYPFGFSFVLLFTFITAYAILRHHL